MKKLISTIDVADLTRLANEAGEKAARDAFAAGVLVVNKRGEENAPAKSAFAMPRLKRKAEMPVGASRKRANSGHL